MRRAQRGEVDAYEQLVRTYQGIATRTAYVITGQEADAEDAAQAGFVKAYYALDRFQLDKPFRPWLLKIVANEARNRRRAAGRRAGLQLRLAEDRPGDAAPSPEGTVLASEPRRALLDAMNALKEDDRLVIAYRYFLDLSEAEMAATLGVARGTVKSRLSRALGRLKQVLAEQSPEVTGADHE
ncbi:MAG TPA: sigma-70 family RNA polymerase sigma factor [Actinomycetota bacterium]